MQPLLLDKYKVSLLALNQLWKVAEAYYVASMPGLGSVFTSIGQKNMIRISNYC